MRILALGASGAIGAYVARVLSNKGHRVSVGDVATASYPFPAGKSDIQFLSCDITDKGALEALVDRVDPHVVLNFAIIQSGHHDISPLRQMEVGILGLGNILELARNRRFKTIFCSSRAVYGWRRCGLSPPPLREDAVNYSPGSLSIYDSVKFASERLAAEYRDRFDVDVTALRFSATFGLGKSMEIHGPQSLINSAIEDVLAGRDVIWRGVSQRNDFVYYGDIADAFLKMSEKHGPSRHPVYNIGGGKARSLRAYGKAIQEQVPGGSRLTMVDGGDYLETGGFGYVQLDHSRAAEEFGYRPRFTPRSAVADYLRTRSLLLA